MKLAMLLALILPLQGFASAWNCGSPDTVSGAAHQHCSADAQPHHHCGTCCAAAIAALPFRWTAPRAFNPGFTLPQIGPPPRVALDRLDRPPRPL
jgi:hypothetical protein